MFTTEDGFVRNWITRIYRDSQGFLWLCTVDGVSIFDGKHFTNFTNRDGLPNRFVTDVVETGSGECWLATLSGLARLNPRHPVDAPAFTAFKLGTIEAANRIDPLVEDSNRQMWCITADGLYRFSTIATLPFHPEKIVYSSPWELPCQICSSTPTNAYGCYRRLRFFSGPRMALGRSQPP